MLLVNPIRDGLNLVAKEGAIVNERDGVLCSRPRRACGSSWPTPALEVNPYDIAGTADALDRALRMPAGRAGVAGRTRCASRPPPARPLDWLADQLAAAGPA